MPAPTNIVVFELAADVSPDAFLRHLDGRGVRALNLSGQSIRCVFHLDVDDDSMEPVIQAFRGFAPPD